MERLGTRVDIYLNRTEEEEDETMEYACEVTSARLLKKIKRPRMMELCNDFGVPCTGTKSELADCIAEQLHYETDTDNDD